MSGQFLDRYAKLDSPVHRLDARVKILLTLIVAVVVVSTPCTATWAFVGYAGLLCAALLVSRVPLLYVLVRLSVVLPFVGMVAVFLPFLPETQEAGGYNLGWGAEGVHSVWWVLWNVVAKALLGAAAVIGLTSTTPFPRLLEGLRRLWVPRLLILMLGFTYRYLFVLVEEARRMKRAIEARAYGGRWLWQAGVIGRLIGTLFVRSYERGERVYLAMASRGFDGGGPLAARDALCRGDAACAALVATALLAIRFFAA